MFKPMFLGGSWPTSEDEVLLSLECLKEVIKNKSLSEIAREKQITPAKVRYKVAWAKDRLMGFYIRSHGSQRFPKLAALDLHSRVYLPLLDLNKFGDELLRLIDEFCLWIELSRPQEDRIRELRYLISETFDICV